MAYLQKSDRCLGDKFCRAGLVACTIGTEKDMIVDMEWCGRLGDAEDDVIYMRFWAEENLSFYIWNERNERAGVTYVGFNGKYGIG